MLLCCCFCCSCCCCCCCCCCFCCSAAASAASAAAAAAAVAATLPRLPRLQKLLLPCCCCSCCRRRRRSAAAAAAAAASSSYVLASVSPRIRVKIRWASPPLAMSESRRLPAMPGRGPAATGDSAACGPEQTRVRDSAAELGATDASSVGSAWWRTMAAGCRHGRPVAVTGGRLPSRAARTRTSAPPRLLPSPAHRCRLGRCVGCNG